MGSTGEDWNSCAAMQAGAGHAACQSRTVTPARLKVAAWHGGARRTPMGFGRLGKLKPAQPPDAALSIQLLLGLLP